MTSFATANEAAVAGEFAAPTPAITNTTTSVAAATVVEPFESKHRLTPLQDLSNCCLLLHDDDESQSDGREKTDSTPENIKKIDDVIDTDSLRNHFWRHPTIDGDCVSSAAPPQHPVRRHQQQHNQHGDDDESNVKLDLDKSSSPSTTLRSTSAKPGQQRDTNESDAAAAVVGDESSLDSAASTAAAKQSFAFTIDNFNEKDADPAATAVKYKNMLERFQNRHRRGASMSKLESGSITNNSNNNNKETLSNSCSAQPLSTHEARSSSCATRPAAANEVNDAAAAPKVKLRPRDRSTSRVRDASKRHSWSPRSSSHELSKEQQLQQQVATQKTQNQIKQRLEAMPRKTVAAKVNKTVPPTAVVKSAATARQSQHSQQSQQTQQQQQFTPRSTAMQMALQKVDFMCAQPPLVDFKHLHIEGDNISETGTYTLDGDNYTEEQKDLMNIDKSTLERMQRNKAAQQQQQAQLNRRPNELPLKGSTSAANVAARNNNNVLEVSYYHESPAEQPPLRSSANDFMLGSHQSASAYLAQIKSRVLRNMSATKCAPQQHAYSDSAPQHNSSSNSSCNEQESSSTPPRTPVAADLGTFTSVTTSGVLAKQSALDARPKLTRRSSLSTSQIDSSEYISNEAKLRYNKAAAAYAGGGFTDHQKAAYRLNVFTNQKEAAKRDFLQTPPESPTVADAKHLEYKTAFDAEPPLPPPRSDAALLQSAHNKNDWIQEWARNARARSLAADCNKNRQQSQQSQQQQSLMTRSYTCSENGAALNDELFLRQSAAASACYNKSLAARYRLIGGGDCDYASDPAISTTCYSGGAEQRPPKSPSKIPSPLHSLGRARSASRTRAHVQQQLLLEQQQQLNVDEADDEFLQQTAAAINSLQQSLSRRNSLKSPHSGSPRLPPQQQHAGHAYYSPVEQRSPQHSLASPNNGYAPPPQLLHNAHKRQLSMENYARDQLPHQLMTSSYNEQQLQLLTAAADYMQRPRGRKNSYDDAHQLSPATTRRRDTYDATQRHKQHSQQQQQQQKQQQQLSPLRRSSSFSAKIATQQRPARPQFQNLYTPPAARHNYVKPQSAGSAANAIKKSASSNNFGHAYSDYDEHLAYYIKDADDEENDYEAPYEEEEYYSSGAELDDEVYHGYSDSNNMSALTAPDDSSSAQSSQVPLSNTRYNKALLMRIERSKQKVSGNNKPTALSAAKAVAGVAACPNTPELPRRNIKSAPRATAAVARQSMPRDTSLNRLAGKIPNSLASAKRQLLQTAAVALPATSAPTRGSSTSSSTRVQPKYLDISKYKPTQGNNFLRKNDAKSTLKPGGTTNVGTELMKRSPSASSMGLSRADPTRASNRSTKSTISSAMTTSGTSLSARASSAARRDASASKQKEAEMAMWKRRSKYDPMKAAAEDRRKKEEAKKFAQTQIETTCESTLDPTTYQRENSSYDSQWEMGLRESADEASD